jgi:hypothetical protein
VPPQDYGTGVGFADQQVNGAGPARICTFAGTAAARLTTAAQGDYFDNDSIRHLSHVIPDMLQFFDMDDEMEPPGEDGIFSERSQPTPFPPPSEAPQMLITFTPQACSVAARISGSSGSAPARTRRDPERPAKASCARTYKTEG